MSGGLFDFKDRDFALEIFGWEAPGRGETYNLSAQHRKDGPFENDMFLNELTWDIFCLFHDYDWYKSGDTTDEDWNKSRQFFMDKWFKKGLAKERLVAIINEECEAFRKTLLETYAGENNA